MLVEVDLVALLLGAIPAFAIVLLIGRPVINALARHAARQTAYEDAPQTHRGKTGTPTMGGLLFAVAPLVPLLLVPSRVTLALALLVYLCMAVGAFDDLRAIRRGRNRGLRARWKFVLTGLAAVAFLAVAGPLPTTFLGIGPVPAWLWYSLSVCVVLATTHAVNLTDGLDGLAGGTIVPPLLVLGLAAAPLRVAANSELRDDFGLALIVAIFIGATLGAVLAFLIYNRHPARVFMGDTGSLALGAALAGAAILTGAHLLLPLIGGVFAAETLSVILQVASYKLTRRRIFRMSPLHHHFELAGWPETKVTARFWLASLVLSVLGFAVIARTA